MTFVCSISVSVSGFLHHIFAKTYAAAEIDQTMRARQAAHKVASSRIAVATHSARVCSALAIAALLTR